MTRASIIIPALNEAENLTRNLPLVRQQMAPSDELIVVDNGSEDKTSEVAISHGVTLVVDPVRNRSRARNSGYLKSHGKFVVFLDGDCRPTEGWLNNLLMPFSEPNVGCVAGEIWIMNKGGALASYLAAKGYLSQAENFKHPFLPYAGGANLVFRRTILERIGLFDERLFSGHDADICWRMQLETGAKIVLARDAIVSHSQNPSWRALLRQKRRHAHGAVLLYKKYRKYRGSERRSMKQTYWEYESILKRATRLAWNSSLAHLRNTQFTSSDEEYQLLLEIAEKLGRIEGSLRRCIWYP